MTLFKVIQPGRDPTLAQVARQPGNVSPAAAVLPERDALPEVIGRDFAAPD